MKMRPDSKSAFPLVPVPERGTTPARHPGGTSVPASSQSPFLSTALQASPLSLPDATSSAPATAISCLHYCSCLLTRFSSSFLLLPSQIHCLSYNHTAFWHINPPLPLLFLQPFNDSHHSQKQVQDRSWSVPGWPLSLPHVPTPLQTHRISVLAFPILPLGFCMYYLFFRGKHPSCPHSFAG